MIINLAESVSLLQKNGNLFATVEDTQGGVSSSVQIKLGYVKMFYFNDNCAEIAFSISFSMFLIKLGSYHRIRRTLKMNHLVSYNDYFLCMLEVLFLFYTVVLTPW